MSTKKEKCCECPEKPDLCRGECMCHHSQSERSGFELDNASMGVSASTHIQTESIEWKEVLKVHAEVIIVMESIGFGLLLDGTTFYKKGYELKPREHTTFSMTQAYEIKNAITTAVAKEKKSETLAFERGAVYGAMRVKKELAEEVEKMGEVGHEPTNDSVENARRENVCNQCSRCAVENTAVLGCVDDDCHCHQTVSIEWDRRVGQNNVQLKHEKLRTMQKREAQNGVLEEQNEAGRS